MRILILSNMYPSPEKPYAGIFVKNQVELLHELADPGWLIRVEAMQRRFTGGIGTAAKYLAFTLRCLPHFLRHYDVVHVHYFVPLALLGAAYKSLHHRARLVVTFHGGDVNAAHFRGWRGFLWRAVSKRVDHGIAVGPGVADSVNRFLAVTRSEIRPAGVDSRKFFPPPAGLRKTRDLVFAGSFNERKGLDLLVEALRDERFRNVSIAFVGTGPLRSRIEALTNAGNVEILDHVGQDELRQVYWSARFLVLPSRSEPFGLVISEAMYCGTPAIVSNEPGPLAQVRHRLNGLVFMNGSVEDLRRTLAEALSMDAADYEAMAARASDSNREFDIRAVTTKLASVYRSLATT